MGVVGDGGRKVGKWKVDLEGLMVVAVWFK